MHKIGVCIVNYKTSQLVKECLENIHNLLNDSVQISVVVVDNLSSDNSVKELNSFIVSKGWQSWIYVIENELNSGFSHGNNKAITFLQKHYQPEFFWLLNPDTLPSKNSLTELLNTLNLDENIGIAGSRLEDIDGTGQISGFNYPRPFGDFINTLGLGFLSRRFSSYVIAEKLHQGEPQAVDWVAGASMLIKKSVIEKVGLMDDHYFLYFEEVDYCLAAKKAGYKTYITPNSVVVHHVGASTGISDTRKQAPRRPRYWFESRKRFFAKNYGTLALFIADSLWMIAYLLKTVKNLITHQKSLDPPKFFIDFFMNSIFLRGTDFVPTHLSPEKASITEQHSTDVSQATFFDGKNMALMRIIKEDWIAHGKDWTKPGFRAVAIHRFGVWRMHIKPKLFRFPFSVLYRILYRRARNKYSIELPYSADLGRRVVIEHQGAIVIHGDAKIGSDSIIRQGVTIGNRYLTEPYDAPIIGCKVNIGAGAKLMGSINIGDGATVGANAVVLKDIPAGKTAIGIPAHII